MNNFLGIFNKHQCLEEMNLTISDDYPHRTSVFQWCRETQKENLNLENAGKTGKPRKEETFIDVRKTLEEDKRVTYLQIEEILGLNAPAILSIQKNYVTKFCCL